MRPYLAYWRLGIIPMYSLHDFSYRGTQAMDRELTDRAEQIQTRILQLRDSL